MATLVQPFSFRPVIVRALLGLTLSLGATGRLVAADPGTALTTPQDRRPDQLFSTDTLRLFADDIGYVFTAPARWDETDWLAFGGATAGVVATGAFDKNIRDSIQRHRSPSLDRFMRDYQDIGAQYSFVVLGAFEAYGLGADDRNARNTFVDGLGASLIAGGIITPVLKLAVGRERPTDNASVYRFGHFSSSASFPSGHTTQAFAVASVIAAHYPTLWVQALAYGAAGLVGYARLEQDRHYASDVVAGALIGWSVGQAVTRHNDTPRQHVGFTIVPFSTAKFSGVLFERQF